MDIIVKKSKIKGRGVFAKRDFKKGEIVLKWNPEILTKQEAGKLTTKQKHYLYQGENKYFLMQPPEKYVNHSCDANTMAKNKSDIAIKNIKKGEEVTSRYTNFSFKCKCGSEKCKNFQKKV